MMKNQEMKKENDEKGKSAKMNEAKTDTGVRTDQKKETVVVNAVMMIIGQEKNARFPVNEVEHMKQKYFHENC